MASDLPISLLAVIAVVFLLAGFVKGMIGLGLPTVAIGLLATRMPPAHALAITIMPAIVTNLWQTFSGGYLRDILRRLWPLMIGTCLGVWAGSGLMTGPYARYGTIVLGLLLVIYAAIGLRQVRFRVAEAYQRWVGGGIGLVTGVIAAATGVQVIPSMPYMQAIGMEKDELVQALGVFFTVATLALIFNLTDAGLLSVSTAVPGGVALATAFGGMYVGQHVRSRMDAIAFRRWFLYALIALGIYLAATSVASLLGGPRPV